MTHGVEGRADRQIAAERGGRHDADRLHDFSDNIVPPNKDV
ncbi:hypothetical protein SAMN06297251_12823 [Fulvimarina manganoxydans]|uniref:Uncharacterized protein n=1 Tax=Fulvimarina manganoxydans TaxID=937218 RepID=A0A1W2ELX6_9HYPH|nr:hypothetical protein SAMN06297251_12823 [Fulvimarina manganoxydans]